MSGTVYMLGAGASRAATASQSLPVPLATDFFKAPYIKEFWYEGAFSCTFKNSALYFILTRYFSSDASGKESSSINNINIEEVYSFLHSFDRVFKSTSYRPDYFAEARRQLHEYIIQTIRYSSWNIPDLGYLSRLVASIKGGDSIVTFNWDTLIEQAISATGSKASKQLLKRLTESDSTHARTGFSKESLRMSRARNGRLIKVHGSVTFSYCANEECRRHHVPYLWDLAVESPEDLECDECGSPTAVYVLPPHGAKTYTTSTFFRMQSSLAAQKLASASRIVMIGYSVPVFDVEARSMLRSARLDDDYGETLLEEVIIVNPQVADQRYVSQIRELLGVDNYEAHGHKVDFKTYESIDAYEKTERPFLRQRKR